MFENILTSRQRRQMFRNRPRSPQSEMTETSRLKDKAGKEYIRYSNGMVRLIPNVV